MKKYFIQPGIFLLWLTSCSKEHSIAPVSSFSFVLDKEVYFTIQTNSANCSNNGYYDSKNVKDYGGQTFYYQKGLDSNGEPVINAQIWFSNELQYGGGYGWGGVYTYPTIFRLG